MGGIPASKRLCRRPRLGVTGKHNHDVAHPNVSPSNGTPHTQLLTLGAQGFHEPQNLGKTGRRSLLQGLFHTGIFLL